MSPRIPSESDIARALRPVRFPYEEFARSAQALRDAARSPLEDLARTTHAMSTRLHADAFTKSFADARRPFRDVERMLSSGALNYRPTSHFIQAIDAARPRVLDLARHELLALRSFRDSLARRHDLDRSAANLAKAFQSRPELIAFQDLAGTLRRKDLTYAFLHPAVVDALDVPGAFEQFDDDTEALPALTPEEAAVAADELGTATAEAQTATTTGDYRGLLGWIDRIRRQYPNLYVAFVIFITVFGVPIAEYEVQRAWEKFREPKPARALERQVITRPAVAKTLTRDHRFVTATRLVVRSEPQKASHIRGYLYEGEVVLFKRESGAWSLVRFEDGDVVVEGWVFTRYAKKFAPRRTE